MYCLSFVNMQHIISTESAFYSAISSDQEAILEISGHIDLNNLLIYQISDRSTLLFNGGSLSNGKLDVHGPRVINLGNAFCLAFQAITLSRDYHLDSMREM